MSSNFAFLAEEFPTLEKLGRLAESNLYVDPNTCLIKLGMLAETQVNYMFELDAVELPKDNSHNERIKKLRRKGLLPEEIDNILFQLRIKRNLAVHQGHDSLEDSKALLQLAYSLSVWFMQTYGNANFEPTPFVMPESKPFTAEFKSMLDMHEIDLAKQLNKKATSLAPWLSTTVSNSERKKRAVKALNNLRLSEAETRLIIDEQLRKVGWEADTNRLRYSKGVRPQKGRNIAIAEWPVNSSVLSRGFVDYALFVGTQLVGVIEAKAMCNDVYSVIDNQCRDYSCGIKEEHEEYLLGNWNGFRVPFLYATNGRKYLEQFKTKSGIWFRDARQDHNIPRPLRGWPSPMGIMEMLEKDTAAAEQALQKSPPNLLTDPDGLNLRPYQLEAIKKAETAILSGKQTVLLAMATGTGKTRTIMGLIYRFLKAEYFNRILFLVDRTALGDQAEDVFKDVKIEDLKLIDDIYNIQYLKDKSPDKETKVQIATVQSYIKRILYNQGETMPAVTDFDLIIVDEAHRGYILDKDMGEDEVLYRSQDDYVSKFRAVMEYFDAVKIALTATPAVHTTQIFGKPEFEYTYRRAVVEGYLVDHDVPHILQTKLGLDGIRYKKGETVALYDPDTGEITNSDELEDELNFEIDSFNRQVITEEFNRAVLEEISKDLDPEGEGKTLIFAVDDNHADLIVKILREIYEDEQINHDAIMKITGSIAGGNKKKIKNVIRRYKNDTYPNIAVTVDLLTTGVDVPKITTLVFLRKVKSRILFEQMMGRATRQCPDINKTHFEIYDPVGTYESIDAVNTMKPVVQNESASFDDLLHGLEMLDTDKKVQAQVELLVAKIHRRRRALKTEAAEEFQQLSGGLTPPQFADKLLQMGPSEAKKLALEKRRLFGILAEGGLPARRPLVISDKEDELVSHTRGYGKGRKPEDYLEEFSQFIQENLNKMAALRAVCTSPRDLTRKDLKELSIALRENNFSAKQLNTAWKDWKNEDIAADIISFIRRTALGSELLSHEERIKEAVAKLCKNHDFNKRQLTWLSRIENSLLAENIIDDETFKTGAYELKGGKPQINKVFEGKLDDYLQELNDYLYDDGGTPA